MIQTSQSKAEIFRGDVLSLCQKREGRLSSKASLVENYTDLVLLRASANAKPKGEDQESDLHASGRELRPQ